MKPSDKYKKIIYSLFLYLRHSHFYHRRHLIRLRAVCLCSLCVKRNAQDTKMTTRVTEGSRRAAALARTCTLLTTKSEETGRLLSIWDLIYIKSNRVISRLFYFLFSLVKSFMWPINFGECTLAKMFINVVQFTFAFSDVYYSKHFYLLPWSSIG